MCIYKYIYIHIYITIYNIVYIQLYIFIYTLYIYIKLDYRIYSYTNTYLYAVNAIVFVM